MGSSELERPRTPWTVKLVGLAIVVVLAWLVLLPLFDVAASLLALVMYAVVAVVGYQIGKAVGRANR